MLHRTAIGFLVVMASTGLAAADRLGDCRQDPRAEVRVAACTEVIQADNASPDEKASAFVSRGMARTDAGAFRSAITDFTEAIRLTKSNTAAFTGRARANLYLGQLSRSISDFNEAIGLSPGSVELYVERGHAHTVRGDLDAAISDLTHAVNLDPHSWSAYNERGIASFKKGQTQQALDDLSQAIKLIPAPEIRVNRGQVYEALGQSKQAIADYRQALMIDPSLVDARDALRRLGSDDAATAETDRRVRDGQALAQQHCSSCHSVGYAGASPNKDAPPFRDINQTRPLYWLRVPITQSVYATHEKMPDFKLSMTDLDTIVAYINSIASPSNAVTSSGTGGRR